LHAVFYCFDTLDATAGAGVHTVNGCGSAGEVELAVKRPAVEHTIDEAGVEDVACAGGVDYGNLVGIAVVEVGAIPGGYSVRAERSRGYFATEAAMEFRKRLTQVADAGDLGGKVAADYEVIDEGQEVIDAFVLFVKVSDYGDSGFMCPACGLDGCFGVEAVYVKDAGVNDPLALELGGLKAEARVALAEDSALSLGINEDEGARAGAFFCVNEFCFHTEALEFALVEAACIIAAELTYIARGQAPGLACDYRGGDLAACHYGGTFVFELLAVDGKLFERDQGVSCIQTYTDQIYLLCCGHSFIVRGQG